MPSSSLPVTRASLATRGRQRACYLNSTFIDSSTNEDFDLVDISLAKAHNLISCLWEDYFTSVATLTILNGVSQYPLPDDMFKPRMVFYVDTSGYRWPLRRMEMSELLSNVSASTNYTAVPMGYGILGKELWISPRPASTTPPTQILFIYIPQYKPPVSDAEPIEYSMAFGWDEYVVNDVAYMIRVKANEPAEEIFREREKLEAQIVTQGKHRNAGDPPRVRDTGWGGSGPTNPWGQFAIR